MARITAERTDTDSSADRLITLTKFSNDDEMIEMDVVSVLTARGGFVRMQEIHEKSAKWLIAYPSEEIAKASVSDAKIFLVSN